jgi:hypothetical protein
VGYLLFNAFLSQYLANLGGGAPTPINIVYRNYAITSIARVPGSIVTCYTVDIKYAGPKRYHGYCYLHKRHLHLLLHDLRRYKFQLAFTCLEALFQNIMYGVLYAYTPDVFPTPNRWTGIGIASSLGRVAVQCAPIVAINVGSGIRRRKYLRAGPYL